MPCCLCCQGAFRFGALVSPFLVFGGIGVNIPAERLTHVNGTPRELFRPEVYVTPEMLSSSSNGDAIREAGLRALKNKLTKPRP